MLPHLMFIGGPDVSARIELMNLLRSDFRLSALGSEPRAAERFQEAGFRYQSYLMARRVNPVSDFLTFSQLFRLFRRERPDIVHTFDTKPCVYGRLAAYLARVPLIIGTLPGLGSLYAADGDALVRGIRFLYEKVQSLACRTSDLTIFQNLEDRDYFVERRLALPEKTTVVAGSGVRTDVFSRGAVRQQEIQELRDELGLLDRHVVVTMISRVLRTKGVLEFARASRVVRQRCKDVVFLLVGPDDVDSVDRLNPREMEEITQTVQWLGERREIAAILAVTDIFVLPSYYREGIPRVLLEAASMSLPLIAADSPGCRDVIQPGVNGLLVPPRSVEDLVDAICLLVADPELRRRFGARSRQRVVECFDLSVIAGQLRSIYADLLRCKRGSHGQF